jgi:hypothetical protein
MTEESGNRPLVSVVLPCLNEADSITACIREAKNGLAKAGVEGEVVVVDNGSTDGSGELATRAGGRVIEEPVPGYGSALRAGFEAAHGDIVVMADADLSYDLARLGELVSPVATDRADLVLGARLNGTNHGTIPLLHRFFGIPAISFLLRRACGGLDVKDSQSGYRAFRKRSVLDLNLKATGMEFASEMLIRASQEGLRITETHIGYRQRVGTSKLDTFADGWRHVQLITMLAPQLVLFWPGLLMFVLGTLLSIASLLHPAGVAVGTTRWQPIFFAPILVILGTLGTVSGAVVAYHSSLSAPHTVRSFSFVGRPRFQLRTLLVGTSAAVFGLAIDVALFLVWVSNKAPLANGLALAGLAQSLIVAGGSLAAFGMIYRILERRSSYHLHDGDVDVLSFREPKVLTDDER